MNYGPGVNYGLGSNHGLSSLPTRAKSTRAAPQRLHICTIRVCSSVGLVSEEEEPRPSGWQGACGLLEKSGKPSSAPASELGNLSSSG